MPPLILSWIYLFSLGTYRELLYTFYHQISMYEAFHFLHHGACRVFFSFFSFSFCSFLAPGYFSVQLSLRHHLLTSWYFSFCLHASDFLVTSSCWSHSYPCEDVRAHKYPTQHSFIRGKSIFFVFVVSQSWFIFDLVVHFLVSNIIEQSFEEPAGFSIKGKLWHIR